MNVATTDATVTDVEMTETIHRKLDRSGLLPGEHVLDTGYTSADLIVSSRAEFGVELLGPLRVDSGAQAKAKTGVCVGHRSRSTGMAGQ